MLSRLAIRTPIVICCVISTAGIEAKAEEQDLWERDKLTGDWGGARTALEDKGIDIGLEYIGESLGVPSGGLREGLAYEGRVDLTVDTDLEKLIGWTGAKAQVRVFQIHDGGRNAAELVGSLADPSNIDATPTTRLFTAWLQQDFDKQGSIRIGQLAADDEFFISDTAAGLINGTFGWPALLAANLPSGGPAYPLATPGIRAQIDPVDSISILAGVFSGDPAGKNCDRDPQVCNDRGTTFSFSGGALWIGEAQYKINQDKEAQGLAAAYKIGAWYHSGNFADQHFGLDPSGNTVTLATTPTPSPLLHRGNWGAYGIVDQMVWRDKDTSANLFLRGGFSPSDRNLISWYIDGGVGFAGLIPGRSDDTLTFGVAYSRISGDAANLDRDTQFLSGSPFPTRSGETVFELSYIAQFAPWLSVQPDIQYIVKPGGNAPDPNNPTAAIENAFVIGARVTVDF